MKYKKYIIIFALSLVLSLCVFAQSPKIRVGINFGDSAISGNINLSFENGFQAGYVSDDNSFMPMMFFPENEAVVSTSGANVRVSDTAGNVLFETNGSTGLGISPLSSELDSGIPYAKIGSIKYPDVLLFKETSGKISVTNVVETELYIKGVLPSEVYPSWHNEALKAAAVATRTYTYNSMNGKHKNHGIDLCATTCCQVYSGITRCQDSTNSAVDETKNLVLTYNGSLILAVYHAIGGGVTESAAGAWGGSEERYPYLTVVETPFEKYEEIARGHWTQVLYDEDFNSLIKSSSHQGAISSPISSITLDDSTPGYLNNMTITDSSGRSIFLSTSGSIRSFFNTKSANFTIGNVYMPYDYGYDSSTVLTADGEKPVTAGEYLLAITADGEVTYNGIRRAHYIVGKGHGHGVGLSQYGAQFAAKEGYLFSEILSIYYPGTQLVDYTQINQ